MRRHGRTRRISKWAGLVVCIALVAALAYGTFYIAEWRDSLPSEGGRRSAGVFDIAKWSGSPPTNGWRLSAETGPGGVIAWLSPLVPHSTGCTHWLPSHPNFLWWPAWFDYPEGDIHLAIPLWMPLVLIGTPTACLFWSDRRRRLSDKSRCHKCGYDLIGLTASVCPECGASASTRSSAGARALRRWAASTISALRWVFEPRL